MNPAPEKPLGGGSKWPMTALVAIVMALFLTKGGLASLLPLLRALVPVAIAVVAYRLVRSYVRNQLMGPGKSAKFNRSQEGEGRVIDLCPRCGAYLAPGHRCPAK